VLGQCFRATVHMCIRSLKLRVARGWYIAAGFPGVLREGCYRQLKHNGCSLGKVAAAGEVRRRPRQFGCRALAPDAAGRGGSCPGGAVEGGAAGLSSTRTHGDVQTVFELSARG